jgi:hypothetical protein
MAEIIIKIGRAFTTATFMKICTIKHVGVEIGFINHPSKVVPPPAADALVGLNETLMALSDGFLGLQPSCLLSEASISASI